MKMQGKLISILEGIYAVLGLIISLIGVACLTIDGSEALLKFRELLHLLTDSSALLYILTIGFVFYFCISIAQSILAFKRDDVAR